MKLPLLYPNFRRKLLKLKSLTIASIFMTWPAFGYVYIGEVTQPNESEPVIKIVYGCYSGNLSWYQCRLTVGSQTFTVQKQAAPPHYNPPQLP